MVEIREKVPPLAHMVFFVLLASVLIGGVTLAFVLFVFTEDPFNFFLVNFSVSEGFFVFLLIGVFSNITRYFQGRYLNNTLKYREPTFKEMAIRVPHTLVAVVLTWFPVSIIYTTRFIEVLFVGVVFIVVGFAWASITKAAEEMRE